MTRDPATRASAGWSAGAPLFVLEAPHRFNSGSWPATTAIVADQPGSEFPVARCAHCDGEVLCHLDLDDGGADLLRCVECSTEVDPAGVRWLDLAALEEIGYGFVLPAGGCGRPGCGNGRCGRAEPDGAQG
jgi:hypothetical protein